MNKIEIQVIGKTGSGKSVILAAIDKCLKDLEIPEIISEDLEKERKLCNPDKPAAWQAKSLKNTSVHMREINI